MNFFDSAMFQRTRIATTFLRICALSLLWLVGSLPLMTFGPTTMAAYHAAVKVIRRDRGKIFPEFFRAFRENLKNGMLAGVMSLSLTALLIMGIRVSSVMAADSRFWMILSYVYFFLLVLLGIFAMFLFPFFSRFCMTFVQGMKLSLASTFQHLFTALTCLLVWVLGYQIIRFLPAMLIIIPSCCFIVCSMVIEPILRKHTVANEDEDTWYLE